MSNSIPFLYQLQNASYTSLTNTQFSVGVVDIDDAALSQAQINDLSQQGKTLFSYVSIGEAEDYRDYWIDGNWDSKPPDYLLKENPDWEGNFRVKFWDSEWQQIMVDRVTDVAAAGYDGMYLDIVDAYQVSQVKNAYNGNDIRQEMIDFVVRLSAAAKAVNSDFKVITQNAVELLSTNDNDPVAPNMPYLNAIDGLGIEDLWYDDNTTASWSKYDLEYIQLAMDQGKFVLATSYPTQESKQVDFINQAIAAGLVPFIGDRDLTGKIDSTNYQILNQLPTDWLDAIASGLGPTPLPQPAPEPEPAPEPSPQPEPQPELQPQPQSEPAPEPGIEPGVDIEPHDDVSEPVNIPAPSFEPVNVKGDKMDDVIIGNLGNDKLYGRSGDDQLNGQDGDDLLHGNKGKDNLSGGNGSDTIRGGKDEDTLVGNKDADNMNGNKGDDTVFGGKGDDIVRGGKDDDEVHGDEGDDEVFGDKGDDTIDGGGGNDILSGGKGEDVFVFDFGSGVDTILDFKDGDMVHINALIFSTVNQVLQNISYIGKDATIDLGGGNAITLLGVGNLDGNDFGIT